jgi:hypothetical protein
MLNSPQNPPYRLRLAETQLARCDRTSIAQLSARGQHQFFIPEARQSFVSAPQRPALVGASGMMLWGAVALAAEGGEAH